MFMYVAASLGECAVITEQDKGDFYASDATMKHPDFRVMTHSGQEFFIEVKNFSPHNPWRPYKLKES
jgi:hypothetical protein